MPCEGNHCCESVICWIDMVLVDPIKLHDIERKLKLDHNIYAFDDFVVTPSSKTLAFLPRSSCIINVTPLSAAAYCGYKKAVQILLTFPDPHDRCDNVWISPLSLAHLAGHLDIVDMLKTAKSERDETGNSFTIMHIAARRGLVDYVRYLHKNWGVEADIKDVDGITPAIHALYLDDDEKVRDVVSTLLEFGKHALDINPIWASNFTCADVAHAMGKSRELVDWLRIIGWAASCR